MHLTLDRLTLEDFKGVRKFELTDIGHRTEIRGRNGTGKTTLFDGLCFLLFGKDSHGKTDFEIKSTNHRDHEGIEHCVEAVFNFSHIGEGLRNKVTLKKVYAEKWTKKRGTAKSEMTGHTTQHFIDGVPKPKKDFDDYISSLIDESVFRLVTNPAHFNSLPWQKRREILISICGDITDADVIAANSDLAELPGILGERSSDDFRSVARARRSKINDELKAIPVRIDETHKALEDTAGLNRAGFEAEKKELLRREKDIKNDIIQAEAGGMIASKEFQITEIDGQIGRIRNAIIADRDKPITDKRDELREAQRVHDAEYELLRGRESTLTSRNSSIEDKEKRLAELREEFTALAASEFTYDDGKDICPTCKQSLPAERVQKAREDAEADFNIAKSERLEAINKEGESLKAAVQEEKSVRAVITEEIKGYTESLAAKNEKIEAIQGELNALRESATTGEIQDTPEITALRERKAKIQGEIDALRDDSSAKTAELKGEAEEVAKRIGEVNIKIAKMDGYDRGNARIEELKKQEKDLAAEFERLEYELDLLDKFERARASMLDESINKQFRLARFKMFNVQVNGGIEPTCETTYMGVPYSSNMSTGEKIMIGMDIINTLSMHHGVLAPIFIDNAESLTLPLETEAQIIRLVADREVLELQVERLAEMEAAV